MTETETDPKTLPDGEYAIVEALGHRTLIGRVAEVERFGTKMLQVEPIWQDGLLTPVLLGGGSIYQYTPCSREVAQARQARETYQLPDAVRSTVPPALLPAPSSRDGFIYDDDDHLDGAY